jgi:hypothetical protein
MFGHVYGLRLDRFGDGKAFDNVPTVPGCGQNGLPIGDARFVPGLSRGDVMQCGDDALNPDLMEIGQSDRIIGSEPTPALFQGSPPSYSG